jgi:hypothetical protein
LEYVGAFEAFLPYGYLTTQFLLLRALVSFFLAPAGISTLDTSDQKQLPLIVYTQWSQITTSLEKGVSQVAAGQVKSYQSLQRMGILGNSKLILPFFPPISDC